MHKPALAELVFLNRSQETRLNSELESHSPYFHTTPADESFILIKVNKVELYARDLIRQMMYLFCLPSAIVVSDTACCAVGPGFESWRRLGCLFTNIHAFVAWSTLNSRRAASPLVRLVEGEETWKAPDHPQRVLPQNWGGIEQNRTVTCMLLKAKGNDRRKM
ncbi:uncharacterized protein TNCV_4427511 [Trichonephila clavipes]|nr:uncharacterized protein TNCV_4427511 [Trichonephila clavipes]